MSKAPHPGQRNAVHRIFTVLCSFLLGMAAWQCAGVTEEDPAQEDSHRDHAARRQVERQGLSERSLVQSEHTHIALGRLTSWLPLYVSAT